MIKNQPIRSYNKHLFLIAALGILSHILFIDRTPLALAGYLQDDSYVYFEIAKNIASGQGPVVNPNIPTNGYHPLYVVVITPIYLLVNSSDLITPIYLIQILHLFLYISTAILIYNIVKNFSSDLVGLVVSIVWLLNPRVKLIYLSGMETPLQIFLISLLTCYLIRNFNSHEYLNIRQSITIGVLLGLIFLARMDGAFISIGVAIMILFEKTYSGDNNIQLPTNINNYYDNSKIFKIIASI